MRLDSRTVAGRARHEDAATERNNSSRRSPSLVENGSDVDVLELAPRDTIWANQLVELMDASPDSAGQPQNTPGSAAITGAPAVTPQPVPGEPPTLSAEGQTTSKNLLEPGQTLIAGACLVPYVSEGNIGSIYHYSKINWLPTNDISRINWSSAPLLQSIDALGSNAPNHVSNQLHRQNRQPRLR